MHSSVPVVDDVFFGLCVHSCVPVVDDGVLDAAGTEAEADGVAEVTKQLEKQAIEDKEKEEDGEEGDCLTPDVTHIVFLLEQY